MLNELLEWIAALDSASAFLFALPFVVATAALIAYAVELGNTRRREHRRTACAPLAARRRDNRVWS